MKKNFIIILLLTMLFILNGCDKEINSLVGKWDLIEFTYQEDEKLNDYLKEYDEYIFIFEENNIGKIYQVKKATKIDYIYDFTYYISKDKKEVEIKSQVLNHSFKYQKNIFGKEKLIYDSGIIKTEAYWINEDAIIESRTKIILKKEN